MSFRETHSPLAVSFWLLATLSLVPSAFADIVKLKNGGEIRGEVQESSVRTSPQITVTTLTGATVVVNQEDIEFVSRRSLARETYETRARLVADDAAAHWELAEWCRENRLTTERKTQLRMVVEIDPDHEDAHRGLGHTLRDGKWMSRDDYMTSRGYVKYKHKYVTPQELELLQKSDGQLRAEQEWFAKVRLWLGWAKGKHEQRRDEGFTKLMAIDDPDAVAALTRNMSEDADRRVRAYFVTILNQVKGSQPVAPLVKQSLHDVDHEVRYQALNAIKEDQYGLARETFVEQLKDDTNLIVRRAGIGLHRVGNESIIPELIDALVTKHRYRIPQDDLSDTISATTGGNVSLGGAGMALPPQIAAMMQAGQLPYGVQVDDSRSGRPKRKKLVTVFYEHTNEEILSALQRITGEDFGYDERTWKLWWNAKKAGLVKPAQ
ncbi:MAG: hypothetical protein O3A00_08370 [Planctomycetota bacterium]|nr:hypothetical protein [Planctomycetota bacterium]